MSNKPALSEPTLSALEIQDLCNNAIYIEQTLKRLSGNLKGENLAACNDAMNMAKTINSELISHLQERGYRKLADGRWMMQKRR